MLKTFQVA